MSRFNQESETKQLLRAEIRRSPAILREYRRRHSWDWLWHLAIAVFAPLVVVAIFVMGPLMLTGPLQIGLLPRFMEVKNEYLGPSTTSGDILLGG